MNNNDNNNLNNIPNPQQINNNQMNENILTNNNITQQPNNNQMINNNLSTMNNQNNFNQQNTNNLHQQNLNQFNNQTINPIQPQQINNINPMQQNYMQNNNVNQIQHPNIGFTSQPTTNIANSNEEELLKAFIGKNYEKITTKKFNFAGFFFSTLYMFYRKMFLYSLLLFIVNLIISNIINNYIILIAFNVLIGVFVNKVYLYYANQKIAKIKLQNPQKNNNELQEICSKKGGTSIGQVFLGFFTELLIGILVLIILLIAGIGSIFGELINPDNWNITINENETNNTNNEETLVEDVIVNGYSCFGEICNVTIQDTLSTTNYIFNANNIDLFTILGNYKEYVKVDIYYTQNNEDKTIVNYKLFLKSNNEDITNIKTEDELRNKLGLYSIGTHTNTFTLSKIGNIGTGFDDETSYSYQNYTFIDENNTEYKMKYINPDNTKKLNEENQYNITFEVTKGTFEYEFIIKSIN